MKRQYWSLDRPLQSLRLRVPLQYPRSSTPSNPWPAAFRGLLRAGHLNPLIQKTPLTPDLQTSMIPSPCSPAHFPLLTAPAAPTPICPKSILNPTTYRPRRPQDNLVLQGWILLHTRRAYALMHTIPMRTPRWTSAARCTSPTGNCPSKAPW